MMSLNGFLMSGRDDVMHHSYVQFTGEQQGFIAVYHDPVDWMLALWNFWTNISVLIVIVKYLVSNHNYELEYSEKKDDYFCLLLFFFYVRVKIALYTGKSRSKTLVSRSVGIPIIFSLS
jgi:hypothetical protein